MKVQYEKRLVAFIDILGFKDLVNRSISSSAEMDKIYHAMKTILNVKMVNEYLTSTDITKPYEATVTTFSDSVVISYIVGPYGNLFYILLDIIHLQIELASQGILVRGGVTIGDVFHDGQIVYGPAMNEAYRLESKCAKFPRIIVLPETLIKGIKLTHSMHSIEEEAEFIHSMVKKDKDEYYFLDFLSQYQELDYPEYDYYLMLSRIRSVISEGLKKFQKKDSCWAKYKWMKKYFNKTIKHMEFIVDTSDWYEGDGWKLYQDLKI